MYQYVWGFVERLLRKKGDTDLLGINWITGFKHRNPRIKTKIGKRQEVKRFEGFTPLSIG